MLFLCHPRKSRLSLSWQIFASHHNGSYYNIVWPLGVNVVYRIIMTNGTVTVEVINGLLCRTFNETITFYFLSSL